MTLPTLQWNSGGDYGDFATHAGSAIAADTMIEALVAKLAPLVRSDVQFDSFTVFTKVDEDSPAIPRASKVLGVAGTSVATGPHRATQATFSAKSVSGGVAKIVLLDCPVSADFGRITFADLPTVGSDLLAEWFADTNGWAARDNGRPYFFLQLAYTMNEKLRKQYHMT